MVYTDGIHLKANSTKELHAFAKKILLHRCWFENHRHKHYDLMMNKDSRARMLRRALEQGAKLVTDRELIILTRK